MHDSHTDHSRRIRGAGNRCRRLPRLSVWIPVAASTILTSVTAQHCVSGHRSYPDTHHPDLPAPIRQLWTHASSPTWMLQLENRPQEIFAGSLRAQKPYAHLSRIRTLAPLRIGHNPFVVHEDATGNYWGLNWYGDFVPLVLGGPAHPTDVYFSTDLMCIVRNHTVHVFGCWSEAWESVTTRSTPTIITGRGCLIVQDGDTLLGFSGLMLGKAPPAKLTAAGPVRHVVGSGEGNLQRNQQAFTIDATGTRVAIYSAMTHAWHPHAFTSPLPVFDYDTNVVLLRDATRKQLHFFSAFTGRVVTRAFPNYARLVFDADTTRDHGIAIHDPVAKEAVFYRSFDNGVQVLPNATTLRRGGHENGCWILETDGLTVGSIEYHGFSSTNRGSPPAAAGLGPTERTLDLDSGDMVGIAATNQALYGYSAYTGRWTRQTYLGNFDPNRQRLGAQSFFGHVETDSHVYAFHPRIDSWSVIQKMQDYAGIAGPSSDRMVILDGTSTVWASGSDGDRFIGSPLQGRRFFTGDANLRTCFLFVHTVSTYSVVHWWSRGWWYRIPIPILRDRNNVYQLDDGVIIMNVNRRRIETFSGYGDLGSDYTSQDATHAYAATPGRSARFVGQGQPGQIGFLLVGPERGEWTFQNRHRCRVFVGQNGLQVLPIAPFDNQGLLRFDLLIPPGIPAMDVRLQMASARDGALTFGHRLEFRIH